MSQENREEEANRARDAKRFGCIVFMLTLILLLTLATAAYLGGCFWHRP